MKAIQKTYKELNLPPLTAEQEKELQNLAALPEEKINTNDIPEVDFSDAHFYYASSLKLPKTRIYTSIDDDLLLWLKRAGKGYQTRLNDVLRWAKLNGCPLA